MAPQDPTEAILRQFVADGGFQPASGEALFAQARQLQAQQQAAAQAGPQLTLGPAQPVALQAVGGLVVTPGGAGPLAGPREPGMLVSAVPPPGATELRLPERPSVTAQRGRGVPPDTQEVAIREAFDRQAQRVAGASTGPVSSRDRVPGSSPVSLGVSRVPPLCACPVERPQELPDRVLDSKGRRMGERGPLAKSALGVPRPVAGEAACVPPFPGPVPAGLASVCVLPQVALAVEGGGLGPLLVGPFRTLADLVQRLAELLERIRQWPIESARREGVVAWLVEQLGHRDWPVRNSAQGHLEQLARLSESWAESVFRRAVRVLCATESTEVRPRLKQLVEEIVKQWPHLLGPLLDALDRAGLEAQKVADRIRVTTFDEAGARARTLWASALGSDKDRWREVLLDLYGRWWRLARITRRAFGDDVFPDWLPPELRDWARGRRRE